MPHTLDLSPSVAGLLLACAAVLSGCGGGSEGASPGASRQADESSLAAGIERRKGRVPPGTTSSNGSVTLSWTAPTLNVDGTPLTDISGYRLYFGSGTGNMTLLASVTDPTTTSRNLTGVASGTYYFSVAVVNSAGEASDLANPVIVSVL